MLGTVTIALEVQNRGSLPAFPGRYLHAALFSILSHVDADEATWWHDMEGIKPFSLQLSFKEPRQDNIIRRGDILYLHVSVWHSELWGLLEGISEGLELVFGRLRTTIVGVRYGAPFNLLLKIDNELELISRRLSAKQVGRITFEVMTPTSFNGTHGDITFPTASLIFSSLVDKWNAGDMTDALNKDLIRTVVEKVTLERWEGYTKRVFYGRDRGLTGFVGKFIFNISRLTEEENQLITILALFGQHCGIGRLSSQSLGQVHVTLQNK
ncbi:CRISPR system precrRNA processing endoribonuclease RAMP protein Cas6 [Veillonella parvula]|uniref:CRISPR system precrRNA processing endoribonuclease RAMP protein Cas6 n=1 Tax=Veillonella parvula TaxID=29466 RepID=UPI00098A214E|nr:CRISPR system precrRNA processing endoribonuclease RAMP protein Cas6 [Veillonella parvula]